MSSPERIYRGSVRVFSVVFIAVGVVLLVATVAAGGGPLSLGAFLGVVFIAIGAGRLWIAGQR